VKGRGAGRDEETVKSTPPAAQTNTLVQARTCIGEAVRLEKQLWKTRYCGAFLCKHQSKQEL